MGICRQTFQILRLKTHLYIGCGQAQIMLCHLKLISGGNKQHFSWIKKAFISMNKGVLRTSRNSHTGINREVL